MTNERNAIEKQKKWALGEIEWVKDARGGSG
jgi:hypothetical protein